MLKLTALKKKNILLLIPLTICLIGAFVYYFSFIKLRPNDVIVTTSDGTALFSNENPTFKVDFGSKENPQGQVIRFEAKASKTNPFEVEGKKSLFTKIAELFKPEKKLGIQMSLIGVDFSETEKTGNATSANNVQTVAEILGTDKVVTTTNLIDMGRKIGESDTEETVSKQTVVNSNVINGIDLEYQILSGLGLKEEIVINDLEAYTDSCGENCSLPSNKFEFDLSVDDGVVLKKGWFTVAGQSTEIYYFVDGDGKYLAHFLPSYAVDAAGEKTYEVSLDVQEYSVGKFKAVVTVDSNWLLNKDRVYPIRIDPSIVHDDTSDFSGGIFNRLESVTGPKIQVAAGFSCTGGTETMVGSYKLHTFTTSGTLTCIGGGNAEVLVVGGGGGGGSGTGAGGGGGGGIAYSSSFAISNGATTVTVGNGGAVSNAGSNSAFSTLTGNGGGVGGAPMTAGGNGGCGGGAGRAEPSTDRAGGTGSQGYNGGSALYQRSANQNSGGGGGGGMGAVGGTSNQTYSGGTGGAGIAYSISGTSTYYSGGGGGMNAGGGSPGGGGVGGGGASGSAGTANTGGGGGAAAAGGSGIVMVKYIPGTASPWGSYISSVLDLGGTISAGTFSWTASGVATGNGETPYSTTGLVAQWNFNETSGTTAVSGGTCGTSCNGTLTNMTTTGQDAAVGTGWTANNRRWGAGAVMFDGTDDYVLIPDNANIKPTTAITVETWVNLGKGGVNQGIITKRYQASTDPWNSYILSATPTNNLMFCISNGTAGSQACVTSPTAVTLGVWNHIVGTYDGADVKLYINGSLSQSTAKTGAIGYSTMGLYFGQVGYSGGPLYLTGTIDSTRIYSRALSDSEILSNYQTGNIEFQYRVSTNGSSWSDWTAYNDGALVFDGMDDYINVGDNATLDTLTEFSTCTWVRPDSVTDDDYIIGKVNNSTWSGIMFLRDDVGQVSGRTDMYKIWVGQNSSAAFIEGATNSSTAGVWTHVCATFKANDASGLHLYVNGTEDANSPVSTVGITSIDSGTANLTIGRYDPGAGSYFVGAMDNIQLYNRVLTSAEVSYNYSAVGSETPYNPSGLLGFWKFNESSGTTATNSGSGIAFNGTLTNFSSTTSRDSLSYSGWSSKSKRGSDATWSSFDNANLYGTSDLGLVAYWSLDESSGSGAYLTDKATYAPFATGGTVTYSGGYTIHTFTSGGTLTVNNTGAVDALVVGGGGGGGTDYGGGGGAGGVVYSSALAVSSGSYSVTIGNGGAAESTGGNSVFSTVTAYGGGAGGRYGNGGNGGSGGGSGYFAASGGTGVSGQGYNGGSSANVNYRGSGGGGATQAGYANNDGTYPARGGAGYTTSISGVSATYGGGGGAAGSGGTSGAGGAGGGGNGGGGNGVANTGGGGGSCGGVGCTAGVGGSGIVIVRYPSYYVGSSTAENITPTGTTYVNGKHGGARSFNGTSDYLSCTDANCGGSGKLDAMGGSLSIEAWVKPTACSSASVSPAIVDKFDTSASKGYMIYNEYYSGANLWTFYDPVNGYTRSTTACVTGVWTHIVAVYDSSALTKKIYINGKLEATSTSQNPFGDSGSDFNIGRYRNISNYYSGLIDEVRVFNTALSATTIASDYIQGASSSGSVYQQKASGGVIKSEGVDSNRITNSLNDGLQAYWSMNESSGGTAADSINGYDATSASTTITTGIYGNARSFSGSSQYLSRASITSYNTSRTVEFWFNPATTGTQRGILSVGNSVNDGSPMWLIVQTSGNLLSVYHGSGYRNGTTTLAAGTWYHGAYTFDASTNAVSLYLNGKLENTGTYADSNLNNTTLYFGTGYNAYFSGLLDEVKIYNVAKTADEILEEYNATSTYYTNYNLSSTDLSSKNTLPISFAGDKVGAYASVTWGESAYANYQTDSNTLGLWHLDEISGSGAYIKDSSGKNFNGTPTGTTYTNSGKLTGGRTFNGTSDYISLPSLGTFSKDSSITLSAWVKSSVNDTGTHEIVSLTGSSGSFVVKIVENNYLFRAQTGKATVGGDNADDTASVVAGDWYHVVGVFSGGQIKLYVNGILKSVTNYNNANSSTANSNGWNIGKYIELSTSYYYWKGTIDEVSVSNVARTPDEIRQAYEVGLRTHNITVDFGATLNSGNLISSSGDTSFTIDATTQGLSQMGSNLYVGDKIVVREVSSGTEYIAQGTVSAITTATGATTVTSWDTNSTFPSGGFTTKASVFKWQTEYIPIKNRTIGTQVDATSLLTLRFTGAFGGRNMWIDNLRTSTGYINNSAGDAVTFPSSGGYLQYKAIITSQNPTATPYLSQLQLDYSSGGPSMDQIMRHGKWFDGGVKKNYWWTGTH